MRLSKLLMVGTVSFFTLPWLLGLSTGTAQAQGVEWEQIVGIVQTGDVVGSGPTQAGSGLGSALGAAPWVTTGGRAKVNLGNGDVEFEVKGLVLAVGGSGAFTGLPIGATAGVTPVKGTLVCDLNGSAGGGNSTLVDTPAVDLNAQGGAKFIGNVGPLPGACVNEPDIAFLVRIVGPAAFVGRWIAFGAVPIPFGGACQHSECITGSPLTNTCSPCATTVCNADPYCCNIFWDSICVSEAKQICGSTCP